MARIGAMTRCPACLSPEVHASHRLGFLEHGPYTWIALVPFRCADCQTRFYRFAPKDLRRRRRGIDPVPNTDRVRPTRWPVSIDVEVRLERPEGPVCLKGFAENASLDGLRVRLRQAVPEGTRIEVSFITGAAIPGIVRWNKAEAEAIVVHGIRLESPLSAGPAHMGPFRRLRRRLFFRRLLIAVIGLGVIALTTAGLLWLMESFWTYTPQYYEPKDIERQHYLQLPSKEQPPPRKP